MRRKHDAFAKSEAIDKSVNSGNIELVCKDYIYNRTADCEDTTFDCESCHLYPEKVCACAHVLAVDIRKQNKRVKKRAWLLS